MADRPLLQSERWANAMADAGFGSHEQMQDVTRHIKGALRSIARKMGATEDQIGRIDVKIEYRPQQTLGLFQNNRPAPARITLFGLDIKLNGNADPKAAKFFDYTPPPLKKGDLPPIPITHAFGTTDYVFPGREGMMLHDLIIEKMQPEMKEFEPKRALGDRALVSTGKFIVRQVQRIARGIDKMVDMFSVAEVVNGFHLHGIHVHPKIVYRGENLKAMIDAFDDGLLIPLTKANINFPDEEKIRPIDFKPTPVRARDAEQLLAIYDPLLHGSDEFEARVNERILREPDALTGKGENGRGVL